MDTKFVKLKFEVRCRWEGFWPDYRIYVNDEMFTERTFKWDDKTYIKEMLQIEAAPGIYTVILEELEPATGTFTTSHICIVEGDGRLINSNTFEILA